MNIALSYFISNVHKEKPYYYLVKLGKPSTLARMMVTFQKFALTKDEDDEKDRAREDGPRKKEFKKKKGNALVLKSNRYLRQEVQVTFPDGTSPRTGL